MKIKNIVIHASAGLGDNGPVHARFELFREKMEQAPPTWGTDSGVSKLTQAMLAMYVATKWDKVKSDFSDIVVDWMHPTLHLIDPDDSGVWYTVSDALQFKAALTVSGAVEEYHFSISFEQS